MNSLLEILSAVPSGPAPRPLRAWARRLTASGAVATTALAAMAWGASPASAAASFTMTPNDGTFSGAGIVSLSAGVEESQQLRAIKTFEVTLSSTDASPGFSLTVKDERAINRVRDVCINWNPAATSAKGGAMTGNCASPVSAASIANGTYRMTSTVYTCTVPLIGALGCLDQAVAEAGPSKTFKVNIAPKTPGGVKARLDSSPVVSWNANSETDITAYRIFRTDVNKQVGTVLVTPDSPKPSSWTDPCQAPNACTPGTPMTYKVAAVRRSPVESGGVVSSYSSASETLIIPTPQAPGTPGDPAAPGAPAVSNPQNLPAAVPSALPSVVAPTKQIVAPQTRSDKYAPTLPYAAPLPQDGTAPIEAPGVGTSETQPQGQPVAAESVPEQRRPKVQFIAGALVLLVAAMHLARGGGMLLRGTNDTKAAAAAASANASRRGGKAGASPAS
jgi:hypothetical protein